MARQALRSSRPGWAPRWPHNINQHEDIRLIERGQSAQRCWYGCSDGLKEHQQAIERCSRGPFERDADLDRVMT